MTKNERPKVIGLTAEAPYIEIKRKEAIAKLGNKWLLHPDNHAKRTELKLTKTFG